MTVIYFHEIGCRECAALKPYFTRLAERHPGVILQRHDIATAKAKRLNEALCERFGVPWRDRLIAPAVFTAAGVLVRDDVNPDALDRLIEGAGMVQPRRRDWAEVGEPDLAQASKAIEERASRLTFGVVIGAGLLDGVNPCAFAVIVLLVSYLQLSRRRPIDTLVVGGAYALAVFATYFALGLGLSEVLARIEGIAGVSAIMRVGTGLLALTFACLSVRDGLRCLQGRMGDMTLQLGESVKDRVRRVIRWGMSGRRIALAALGTGVAISLLELACTGQVYAPTILFAVRHGGGRRAALFWLLAYNTAFILPLIVVTLLAFGGVRSQRFGKTLVDHAATVKFATALLFVVMAVALLW